MTIFLFYIPQMYTDIDLFAYFPIITHKVKRIFKLLPYWKNRWYFCGLPRKMVNLLILFCNVVYYWEQCGKRSYLLKIGYMVDEYCMKYILKNILGRNLI